MALKPDPSIPIITGWKRGTIVSWPDAIQMLNEDGSIAGIARYKTVMYGNIVIYTMGDKTFKLAFKDAKNST